jgi:nitrogen fixation protein NifB
MSEGEAMFRIDETVSEKTDVREFTPGSGVSRIKNLHPCFGAAGRKARMHLPICPACNIECAFCRRALNTSENRPGVSSFIMRPEDTPAYVAEAITKCADISVVGVAGPGDALVGDNLFQSFSLITTKFPHLLKCISTNGLLLDRRADELIALGIDTLTVTVNAVDPEILKDIVIAAHWNGERLTGAEGARILIENQLAGIRKMASADTTIKVNTVLVPGVNDRHIEEVARTVSDAGASIHNIIALIPQHLLSDRREPSCEEMERARSEAAPHIDVFRHCMHCRADAIGIPGKTDVSRNIYAAAETMAAEAVFSHG